MRSALPSAVVRISYVHVPPNGSFASAIRTTSFPGGSETVVSNGMIPESVVSSQDCSPLRSGSRFTFLSPARQLGMASISVIAHGIEGEGRRLHLRPVRIGLHALFH